MWRPRRFLAVLTLTLLVAVAACRNARFDESSDSGGNLREYAAQVNRLNAQGAAKVIRGVCASACTILLGVKKVCVEPTAELWFHAAHLPGVDQPDSLGSLEMLSFYPPPVREWAIRTQAIESVDFNASKKLSGEQLIGMGISPCPHP